MDTITVPAPPATRELRGLALYRERAGEIVHEGRGVYTVPGCSVGTYTVHLEVFGEGESCTCPDFTTPRRGREPGEPCKHFFAASTVRAKARRKFREASAALSPESVAANLARLA